MTTLSDKLKDRIEYLKEWKDVDGMKNELLNGELNGINKALLAVEKIIDGDIAHFKKLEDDEEEWEYKTRATVVISNLHQLKARLGVVKG